MSEKKEYVYVDLENGQLSVWNEEQLNKNTGYRVDCNNLSGFHTYDDFIPKGKHRDFMHILGLELVGDL